MLFIILYISSSQTVVQRDYMVVREKPHDRNTENK